MRPLRGRSVVDEKERGPGRPRWPIEANPGETSEAARRSYTEAVDRAFEAQKSSVRLSRTFFEGWVLALEEGAEVHRHAVRNLSQVVRAQQRLFRELSEDSLDAYDGFLGSLASFHDAATKQAAEEPERPEG